MTSRMTSLVRRQRELLLRRLWPAALTFLSFLLYHVVGMATLAIRVMHEASAQHMTELRRTAELSREVLAVYGADSRASLVLAFPLAMILAIEGFAWMDSRREVDFYESQPVPRGQRFFDLCTGSFLYFFFSYVSTLEIGLVIISGAGALTRAMCTQILLQSLLTFAFFAAIYGLGVLSVMLTGNVVVACLAFFVLLWYEGLFKLVLKGYCSEFFATWSGHSSVMFDTNIFDPFYHAAYGVGMEGTLRLLALAVLYFILALACYRLRRNEYAGTAVVFGPVRTVVRIALALLAGLIVGLLFSSLEQGLALPLMWMVLFTVITACIMQIIYEYDFRALFHRPLEIAAAVALVLLLYFGFYFDVAGYDRFVPDPANVTDAALICTDVYDELYDEQGKSVDAVAFGEAYMHLDNVEDVIAIARFGQEFTRKKKDLNGADGDIQIQTHTNTHTEEAAAAGADDGPTSSITILHAYGQEASSFTVLYRMKSGKKITRSFQIPALADPAMLDAVIGTPQYREGSFNLYHDTFARFSAGRFLMDYTNGLDYGTMKMDAGKYEDFRSAYLQDLTLFSYSFARKSLPVGKVTLNSDTLHSPDAEDDQKSLSCPVYAEFTNTIAFLRRSGIWKEPVDLPDRDREDLSRQEQELLDSFDYWAVHGPFSPEVY